MQNKVITNITKNIELYTSRQSISQKGSSDRNAHSLAWQKFYYFQEEFKNYNHDHTSLQYSVFDDKVVFTLFKKDKLIQFFSNHTKCSQHIDFLNCLIAVLISLLIMISGISNLRKIQNEKVHEKFTFFKNKTFVKLITSQKVLKMVKLCSHKIFSRKQ